MSRRILILSVENFKKITSVHDNTDEKLIRPEILSAQDVYIMPILGSKLYNKILDEIEGSSLAGKYKELVEDYIFDSLAWHAMAELPDSLSIQFTNKGLQNPSGGENSNNADAAQTSRIIDKYRNRAAFYCQRMKAFVLEFRTDFPEYDASTTIGDVKPSNNTFRSPVFLRKLKPIKEQPSYND